MKQLRLFALGVAIGIVSAGFYQFGYFDEVAQSQSWNVVLFNV